MPPDTSSVELPPAIETKPDKVGEQAKAEPGTCQTCGEPIIREPGARGRMPKYHPDCRPLKAASTSTSTTRARTSKAESEAKEAVAAFQQLVTKAAIMLSVVDRFDAFCVMVALPDISTNLEAVLVRYEWLRKEMLAAKTGGSVVGLIIAVLMMSVPMAAHHGLLGRGNFARLVMEMPFTLLRIQQRLKEGSEALTEMMRDQLQKAAEENRKQAQAKATQNAES